MDVTFLDEKGETHPMEMGCYGIGITRIVAAAIEQNHDERGIIWPDPMAPFAVAHHPARLSQERGGEGRGGDALRASSWAPRASTCCSTIATSAPA